MSESQRIRNSQLMNVNNTTESNRGYRVPDSAICTTVIRAGSKVDSSVGASPVLAQLYKDCKA